MKFKGLNSILHLLKSATRLVSVTPETHICLGMREGGLPSIIKWADRQVDSSLNLVQSIISTTDLPMPLVSTIPLTIIYSKLFQILCNGVSVKYAYLLPYCVFYKGGKLKIIDIQRFCCSVLLPRQDRRPETKPSIKH